MTVHVLYHALCYDGFGVAWAVSKKYPDAVLHPCFHGHPPPDLPADADVIIGDFSFPREVLVTMKAKVKSLVVLDHHKSAKEALTGLEFCHFDMTKSGAVLVYEYLFPDQEVPLLLRYIQDRDLWLHQLPFSKEVVAYIYTQPMDVPTFDNHHEILDAYDDDCGTLEFVDMCEKGEAIGVATDQMVAVMADNFWWMNIGGYDVPVTNASVYFSEVAGELCLRHPEAPFAAYFFDRKDGTRQYGLRSRNGFDVSEVAKKYGGGGHPGAAGFTVSIGRLNTL